MDKQKLVQAFIQKMEADLLGIKAAARATYEAATHEEAKAENQYDTRAIEASYLAGAQAQRAGEIDEILSLFQNVSVKNFAKGEGASATAFVVVELNGRQSSVFLMPKGGGFSVQFEGTTVQIVTPQSHLGEALLDRVEDEEFDVEIGDQLKTYRVLKVL